jgi:hypothetical protein
MNLWRQIVRWRDANFEVIGGCIILAAMALLALLALLVIFITVAITVRADEARGRRGSVPLCLSKHVAGKLWPGQPLYATRDALDNECWMNRPVPSMYPRGEKPPQWHPPPPGPPPNWS